MSKIAEAVAKLTQLVSKLQTATFQNAASARELRDRHEIMFDRIRLLVGSLRVSEEERDDLQTQINTRLENVDINVKNLDRRIVALESELALRREIVNIVFEKLSRYGEK
jgi:multidrug resistance efflux pump